MSNIVSVFEVTNFKENKKYEQSVEGSGQEAIRAVRREYPRFSKIVLQGFEVDGNFKHLKLH